ncbi:MAG: hypothetical protein WAO19_06080 [Candidatus Kryptoniota bacterium]
MINKVLPLLFAVGSLCISENVAAQGDTTHAVSDSIKGAWGTSVAMDFFITGELYTLHFSGPSSLTPSAGVGAEFRFKPVFIGYIAGFSGDEGIPGLHGMPSYNDFPYSPSFTYSLVYCGGVIVNYRFEMGEIKGQHYGADQASGYVNTSYSSVFLGVSKRFGKIFLFEPELKIMFPVSSGFPIVTEPHNGDFPWVIRHYHISDLFFAIGFKIGAGFELY